MTTIQRQQGVGNSGSQFAMVASGHSGGTMSNLIGPNSSPPQQQQQFQPPSLLSSIIDPINTGTTNTEAENQQQQSSPNAVVGAAAMPQSQQNLKGSLIHFRN